MDQLTCIPAQHDSTRTPFQLANDLEPTITNNNNNNNERTRACRSCQQPCSDSSVIRALGEVYHYDCFTCEDCHILVVDKFYALNTNQEPSKFKIVCENHYCYAQVGGTLCPQCRLPLIKPLTPTHPTHLGQQCRCQSSCPDCTAISRNEACYEYDGKVYCLLHFSGIKETQCFGCHQAILKKFVDHKSHPGKIWHPECYMIYKFWNVRLADTQDNKMTGQLEDIHAAMDRKVNRIWTDLSSFEESSATCISDMLLLVAAGAYVEGFRMACQFVMHLQVLFGALDDIQHQMIVHHKDFPCGKEAKLVCSQVIRFFKLLAQPDKKMETDSGVTQELLSLVASLAQTLKTLIRIGLTEALNLERDCHVNDAISRFLDSLLELDRKRVWIGGRYWFKEEPFPKLSVESPSSTIDHKDTALGPRAWDQCYSCHQPIDSDCYQHANHEQWHPSCFLCSACNAPLLTDLTLVQLSINSASETKSLFCNSCAATPPHNDTKPSPFVHLSQLQHYLYLLKLALTELSVTMNSSSAMIFGKNSTLYDQATLKTTDNPTSLPPVTFLPVSKEHQRQNHHTPFFGSVNLSTIKRAKSTHLDRINEHTQGGQLAPANKSTPSTASVTSATPPKRSLTQYEPNKRPAPHHPNSVQIAASSSSSISSSTPTALSILPWQTDGSSNSQRSFKSPLSAPLMGGRNTNVFSATRRASTNAIQKMGSIRRALSQKRDTDGGSIYSLFDRRQSQKQHHFESTSTPQHLRITTTDPPLQSSSISFQSASSLDSPLATSPLSLATHDPLSPPHHHLLSLSPKQYIVIRSIAARSIASFAPDLYTREEWMLLVQYRKQSLWGKLKTRIRSPSPSSSTGSLQQQQHHQKVFGVSLGTLKSTAYRSPQQAILLDRYHDIHEFHDSDTDPIDMDGAMENQSAMQWMVSCFASPHCKVPLFVQHCILVLLQRDLSVEGIFRKNGNIRELKQIEEVIDKDASIDNTITTDLLVKQTSIQLAALLKRYLRELPEPLLTFKLYPVFVAAAGLETEEETKAMLHLACCMLPKENRDTMQVVFGFFQHVSTFKDINKMGVYNMARVMAPSVLHGHIISNQELPPTNITNSSILTDRTPNDEIKVVEMLIRHHDQFGKTPDDMIPLVSDPHTVEWIASLDTKQFIKSDLHATPPFRYHSRFQPSSVPTLSTTANSSEAALSPITPVTPIPGRRQSVSITPLPDPAVVIKPTFHRSSWIGRKQHA